MRSLLPLVLAAALLAGCSDDTDPVAAPSATALPTLDAPSPSPSPTPEGPVDPLSPMPAVESAAPAGQPTCRPADLTVVDADSYDEEEGLIEVFVIRTKGAPCQLEGWPRVSFLDARGARLPMISVHGGHGIPDEQPATMTLTTGTSLSFLVGTPTTGSCRQAATLVVTLPGTTQALRATTPLQLCGSEFGVSPVRRLTHEE